MTAIFSGLRFLWLVTYPRRSYFCSHFAGETVKALWCTKSSSFERTKRTFALLFCVRSDRLTFPRQLVA